MQHYGLTNLWHQGDLITRMIAATLLFTSILSWTVILFKTWYLLRLNALIKKAEPIFWSADDFNYGIQKLRSFSDHPLLILALAGQQAVNHYQSQQQQNQHEQMNKSDWIISCLKNSITKSVAQMQSGLAILASIGSTTPFIGLLGTVWGIYHALLAIGKSGQTSLEHVAGPVGEALIMTALGLFVAIPAVLGYNMLVRRSKTISSKLYCFAHDLHAYLCMGIRPYSGQ